MVKREDLVREIEVFKYFDALDKSAQDGNLAGDDTQSNQSRRRPSDDGEPLTSPNQVLTALAQLCAIRLNASRAMISVIDRNTQYFIAEATRTLDLKNTTKSDSVRDGLWAGCTSVAKEGRLCERTIELKVPVEGYACFTISDLSQDDRFKDLPFVRGPPFFRFYAGTPITTRSGINIGSLFVIDENVRPDLSDGEVQILGTLAGIIMKHLELASEAEVSQSFMTMKKGINAFQSGRNQIEADPDTAPMDHPVEVSEDSESEIDKPVISSTKYSHKSGGQSIQRGPLMRDAGLKSVRQNSLSSDAQSRASVDPGHSPQTISGTEAVSESVSERPLFSRAAYLVRQSLRIEQTGGVCFYDASTGFTPRTIAPHTHDSGTWEGNMAKNRMGPSQMKGGAVGGKHYGVNETSSDYLDGDKKAATLAYSTAENDFGSDSELVGVKSFHPMPERFLHHLVRTYPRGKLWTFTEIGSLSSTDDESVSEPAQPSGSPEKAPFSRRSLEARMLQTAFPNTRQLLFFPLWDPMGARWHNGCFCFSSRHQPVMSKKAELSFLLTFGSCIMTEYSRLESVAADIQKSDFIGSISHELRSPLHGVLASAEFLSETPSDPFQSSLINTVSSCGKTLLDTINHVLDFSKINKFEKSWVTARNSRTQKSVLALNNRYGPQNPETSEAPPLLNIYSTTDLAAVVEEVVESVYAGQVYQDISSTDVGHKSSFAEGNPWDLQRAVRGGLGSLSPQSAVKDVEVILDISYEDYTFTTQIGAVRRVIMNVFGNALKYTNKGLIAIKLSLTDLPGFQDPQTANERLLLISIRDTGKGIASKYLKESLYKPFSQEDSLATGVGLGLSIVKSIVMMLNGTIDVHSQVDVGTQVDINIPLLRLPGAGSSTSTPSTVASTCSTSLSPVILLVSDYPHKTVLLYGFDLKEDDLERHRVLELYMKHWFSYQVATTTGTQYDIIVVDEQNLFRLCGEIEVQCPVVILCGASPPRAKGNSRNQEELVLEVVSKPFGPYKLAKSFQNCFSRRSLSNSQTPTEVAGGHSEPSDTSVPVVQMPEVERVNLGTDNVALGLSKMGSITANDTANANMAINHPAEFSSNESPAETDSSNSIFPYMPPQVTAGDRFKVTLLSRPRLDKRVTAPAFTHATSHLPQDGSAIHSKQNVPEEIPILDSTITSAKPQFVEDKSESRKPSASKMSRISEQDDETRSPGLLLVEDNKINLRLLETYMRKRNYQLVDSAENGQLAVHAAEAKIENYDIIFMDISMPIMNGFEATRAIRELEDEKQRRREELDGTAKMKPALIIALTGLASAKDQAEAFASGVDLFMTKPVSFKEIGQLLDNWEANEKGEHERQRNAEALDLPTDASKLTRTKDASI